jgi:DNA-binding LytR/AlgR family response regulator
MTRFRAISVDDEPSAHIAVKALLEPFPEIELAATCLSTQAADDFLHQNLIDLLFLDVTMPSMSGLDWLRSLSSAPATILMTAHNQHALEAYDLGVSDYLVKPVSPVRLQRCLKMIKPVLVARRTGSLPHRETLALKVGGSYRLVDPMQIRRVEAEGNFSRLFVQSEEILASESLKDLAVRLALYGFMRVHKSHVVNRSFVHSAFPDSLKINGGGTVPIGRAHRHAVRSWMMA